MGSPTEKTQVAQTADQTRNRLLDAAVAALVDTGYSRFTLALVAEKANMTPGALQHHFHTKASLLRCVLGERLLPAADSPELPSQRGKPVAERCKAAIGHYWRIYGNHDYGAVWQVVLGARDDPELQQHVAELEQAGITAGKRNIQMAFDGLPLGEVELIELGYLIASALTGIALLRPLGYPEAFFEGQVQLLCDVLEHHVQHRIS